MSDVIFFVALTLFTLVTGGLIKPMYISNVNFFFEPDVINVGEYTIAKGSITFTLLTTPPLPIADFYFEHAVEATGLSKPVCISENIWAYEPYGLPCSIKWDPTCNDIDWKRPLSAQMFSVEEDAVIVGFSLGAILAWLPIHQTRKLSQSHYRI